MLQGRGSNFQAVIDAIARREIPATCCGLITDNPDAYAIVRAEKAGIPVIIVDYRAYPAKEAYEQALYRSMKRKFFLADLDVLAGYMRILGACIVKDFHGQSSMNIHPALPPGFPGLHAQRQALGYGVRVSGCTVHFVDEGMDSGPVIVQACVRVEEDDDEETLAARILVMEHRCLPEAIRLFCEDRLMIDGRRVRILPGIPYPIEVASCFCDSRSFSVLRITMIIPYSNRDSNHTIWNMKGGYGCAHPAPPVKKDSKGEDFCPLLQGGRVLSGGSPIERSVRGAGTEDLNASQGED